MRELRVALVPGDGIGVDVMAEAVKALTAVADTAGDTIFMAPFDWGAERYLRTGETLPAQSVETLAGAFDAILLGPLGDPRVSDNSHAVAIVQGLRRRLDLYVHHRPAFLLHEKLCPMNGVAVADVAFDLFRENTGSADAEAGAIDASLDKAVERLVRHAFAHARRHGRARVALADQCDPVAHPADPWRRVFGCVAADYPEIEATPYDVDSLARELLRDPKRFQVIATSSGLGDILDDHATLLQGGRGVAASASVHPGRVGLFQPVHGPAAPAAGKATVNPIGAILTAALMLEHSGWTDSARRIEDAVRWAVANDRTTPDVGGTLDTRAAGEAIVARLVS